MKRLNKNGSAWMTEETGKFVVSVLVIVLLIMLVVKLVSLFTVNNEYKQAKATLEEIGTRASQMASPSTGIILIEGPKNWQMFTNKQKPRNLCLCPIKECEESKIVCKIFPLDIIVEPETDSFKSWKKNFLESNIPGSDNAISQYYINNKIITIEELNQFREANSWPDNSIYLISFPEKLIIEKADSNVSIYMDSKLREIYSSESAGYLVPKEGDEIVFLDMP